MPTVTAIIGPTAVGKTALALELAAQRGAEIVSADSRQIYRGMTIGTAKPTAAELAAVPHHLIDIRDPDQPFSLAEYQDLALAAIADIQSREKPVLLVGGTGQYLAALLEGWQIPRVAPQPALRAELEQLPAGELFMRLQAADPAAAAQIGPSNIRRLIRALEVFLVSGTPISVQQTRSAPPFTAEILRLQRPREELFARADARVEAMLAAGLIDEVRGLVARGYGWDLPAMNSLGYIEFAPYLAGDQTLDQAVERLKFNTHAFIRRQEAWFRRLAPQG
jgi:tRNA dimethylallyltransferase